MPRQKRRNIYPDNYLEVTYQANNLDAVKSAISAELSKEYEISTDTYDLDNISNCTVIDASAGVDGKEMPWRLQTVYLIPAGDGTVVATAHYSIEAAEGFGHLFGYMANTIIVNRN